MGWETPTQAENRHERNRSIRHVLRKPALAVIIAGILLYAGHKGHESNTEDPHKQTPPGITDTSPSPVNSLKS